MAKITPWQEAVMHRRALNKLGAGLSLNTDNLISAFKKEAEVLFETAAWMEKWKDVDDALLMMEMAEEAEAASANPPEQEEITGETKKVLYLAKGRTADRERQAQKHLPEGYELVWPKTPARAFTGSTPGQYHAVVIHAKFGSHKRGERARAAGYAPVIIKSLTELADRLGKAKAA